MALFVLGFLSKEGFYGELPLLYFFKLLHNVIDFFESDLDSLGLCDELKLHILLKVVILGLLDWVRGVSLECIASLVRLVALVDFGLEIERLLESLVEKDEGLAKVYGQGFAMLYKFVKLFQGALLSHWVLGLAEPLLAVLELGLQALDLWSHKAVVLSVKAKGFKLLYCEAFFETDQRVELLAEMLGESLCFFNELVQFARDL